MAAAAPKPLELELEPEPEPVRRMQSDPNPAPAPMSLKDPKGRAGVQPEPLRKTPTPRHQKQSRSRRLSTFDSVAGVGAIDAVVEVHAHNVVEGKLEFVSGREVLDSSILPPRGTLREARQAYFVKCQVGEWVKPYLDVEQTRRVEQVRLLRGLCDFMRNQWSLSPPSVIISVTGDAGGLNLRPNKNEIFRSALLNATRSTNAWCALLLISTGFDCFSIVLGLIWVDF